MYKGNKRESVLKEVWWVVRIVREAKVVGVRVWIMTLMQRDDKKVLHPVVFFSKTMNEAQWNYDVYN